jgi:CRP-like cAMP-binding protein
MKQVDVDQDIRRVFSFLDDNDLAAIQSELLSVDLVAGDVLFSIGEVSSLVYWLVSGRLAVRKMTGFAEKMQVVALLDPGALVGEGGIFPDQTHAATVVAVDHSRLVSLSGKSLEALRERHPATAWKIIARLLYISHLRLSRNSDRLARIL